MKIAIFCKIISLESRPFIERLHQLLSQKGIELFINERFQSFLTEHCNLNLNFKTYSDSKSFIEINPKMLLTIGGDGTFLDAATFVRDSNIPILGINTGRLGFLANISKEEIEGAVEAIIEGNYSYDDRTLLTVKTDDGTILNPDFALNEVTVSRKDTTSMITIHSWIDNKFLNAYWADGLILATPTGSTGYSLSCGGPIVMPGSENFVITPIAPHNLTVRPFVIPNNVEIKLKVEGREEEFLLSMDSRTHTLKNNTEIIISQSPFQIRLVQTHFQDFASTLRNKLLWGLDRRN